MRLEDTRRLTGSNLFGPRPLVLAEFVLEDGEEVESVREAYRAELARLRGALGLPPVEPRVVRAHPRWVALAFEAPLDEMLADAEAAEWAGTSAAELRAGRPALPLEPKQSEIAAMRARDVNPRLPALEAEAARRGVPFLWDDEEVSLGHGRRAVHFARHHLPEIGAVPWETLGGLPIVLITGTNGKTTSTRLLARMAREAGRKVGSSHSDAVTLDGKDVRQGDWTGPAAARLVLRSPEVELAVLETARGGILRRGLACDAVEIALITNVSDDHLGTYGIEDLDGMMEVKAVVARAARGLVVLNARDERLVALAGALKTEVTFFADTHSLSPAGERVGVRASAVIAAHCAKGGRAVVARAGQIVILHGATETPLLPVADVPITFGGAARYNVENALGAVAAALGLGLPLTAIVSALKAFGAADNPGRGETWTRAGVTAFLDYAHNPDGVASALQVAAALRRRPSDQLFVLTGSAGDRTDAELEAMVERIHQVGPALVILRELPHYLRGRSPGELPAFFRRALRALGMGDEKIHLEASEVGALERATRAAHPGDVVALLIHVEREAVRTFLESTGWHRG